MALTLVVISDTHGLHRGLRVPPGDILIHAGDLTNDGSLAQVADLNAWLGTLPHRHKIVIAGNHDHCFERTPEDARALLTNALYLENELVDVAGLRIYGSPVTPWFCDLAFNVRRGAAIRAVWDTIPAVVDVLVTHGPPTEIGDLTADGRHVGCTALRAAVERLQPHVHCFGHIHEASGVTTVGATTFVNASICGAYERLTYPPRVVRLGEPAMDDAAQNRLGALAEEYVAFVEAMRTGQYADDAEWRALSSARTLVHDELLAMTGMTRTDDMYVYCRNLLTGQRKEAKTEEQ